MADYGKAASALKMRWNASAAKSAHLLRFLDELSLAISHEVEMANSALRREGCPEIELGSANPITLTIAGTKCRILLNTIEYMVVAETVSPTTLQSQRSPYARKLCEKQVKFSVKEHSHPPTATKVGASQGPHDDLSPALVAAEIVEDLISELP
jgi:hypothetical protein